MLLLNLVQLSEYSPYIKLPMRLCWPLLSLHLSRNIYLVRDLRALTNTCWIYQYRLRLPVTFGDSTSFPRVWLHTPPSVTPVIVTLRLLSQCNLNHRGDSISSCCAWHCRVLWNRPRVYDVEPYTVWHCGGLRRPLKISVVEPAHDATTIFSVFKSCRRVCTLKYSWRPHIGTKKKKRKSTTKV